MQHLLLLGVEDHVEDEDPVDARLPTRSWVTERRLVADFSRSRSRTWWAWSRIDFFSTPLMRVEKYQRSENGVTTPTMRVRPEASEAAVGEAT